MSIPEAISEDSKASSMAFTTQLYHTAAGRAREEEHVDASGIGSGGISLPLVI